MKIRTSVKEGGLVRVEVIDPTDGCITHYADVGADEQITVTATSARSPADIEFGEVGPIPFAEPEKGEESHQDSPGAPGPGSEDVVGHNGEEADEQGEEPRPGNRVDVDGDDGEREPEDDAA